MNTPKPVILCILDGWGHREEAEHNAIAAAATPNWDALWRDYPHSLLQASESHVGLPSGQMGNSEVGHMTIGAGRRILQDLPRIDDAIESGELAKNPQLLDYIAKLKTSGGACHLLGLLSDGGVHAHQRHLLALAKTVAAAGVQVHVHAFLDGRDTPPNSATTYVKDALDAIKDAPNIQLSTLCGRYFAMDRDKRWDRVEKAYNLLVDAKGERADDALSQLETAYSADISDEFMHASTLNGYAGMHDGDGLLMANFRADRAREILTALLDDAFDGFARTRAPRFAATLGMIEYSDALNPFMPAMFPPESVSNGIGEVTSAAGLKQLRIAETEKYAHVTFFMNGGREAPFVGEERILIPSPDVATYDLQPEMSAPEMTEKLCASITSGEYGLIIANYANPDMVGHSGKFDAAVKAVEAIDTCLGLLKAAVLQAGGAMLITADHGNVEQMIDPASGGAHTAHTLNPVPLVLMQENAETWQLADGTLADLAPSLLALLGLTQPQEMSGRNLIDEAH
jgi:2,3-bisphosphoglycerate-independent phosphoglycerate mutase